MGEREPDDELVATRKRQQQDTGPHTLVMDNWISCAPFERLLHMDIMEASDGKAVVAMPFLVQFAQGAALMHGGALASLADTALAMAIKSVLPAGTDFATVHAEIHFLRPVRRGRLSASAHLVSRDGRKIFGETSITDEAGEQVVAFAATFVVPRDTEIDGAIGPDSED